MSCVLSVAGDSKEEARRRSITIFRDLFTMIASMTSEQIEDSLDWERLAAIVNGKDDGGP